MSQRPTNWQSSAHGAHGGHYQAAPQDSQLYQYESYHPGHPTPPVYNASAQNYPYSTQPAPTSQSYYMSSNQSSQQPSGQDDRAKRLRTTEAGQAQSYPAYATPQPPSHQAQAATAAAADAYRRRAQDAAAAQAAPAAPRPAHPPTELPPRPYPGGGNPYAPPKPPGKITGAQMQYLPGLEARLDRLEHAVDQYVDMRAKKALDNSILPGSQGSSQSRGGQQQGPSASQGQSQQRK